MELFLVEHHGLDLLTIQSNGPCTEIQADPIFIHKWGTNYAVVSVNIDKVEIYFIFDVANTYGYSGPIADFGSAAYAPKLEYHLLLQLECVRLHYKGKLRSH